MAAITVLVDSARKYLLDGTMAPIADTIKVALLGSGYNPRPGAPAWVPTTSYAVGAIIISAGIYYEATIAGYSAGSIPLFSTTRGATTADNTVVWTSWGYLPPPTHTVWADVSAYEISGTGYSAGGTTLTNKAVTLVNHTAGFSADPAVWTNALFSARYAYVYKVGTANAITNPLLALVLLEETNVDVFAPVSAVVSVSWASPGIFSF